MSRRPHSRPDHWPAPTTATYRPTAAVPEAAHLNENIDSVVGPPHIVEEIAGQGVAQSVAGRNLGLSIATKVSGTQRHVPVPVGVGGEDRALVLTTGRSQQAWPAQ